MKIDGKAIAQNILSELKERVAVLKQKDITPHLAIILLGDNAASKSYVSQKEKKAAEVSTKVSIHRLPSTVSQDTLLRLLKKLNDDKNIHGIIVQRPLPDHIDSKTIDEAVDPKKDVDGFHPETKFPMPLGVAVIRILEELYTSKTPQVESNFKDWLKSQKIVIIGKGKTGGGPIIKTLRELGVEPLIIDSKTKNPQEFTKRADIIISTVGNPNILRANMIKKGAIIIGVGMYRGEDGKLHGDYDEEDIKGVAAFYTPIPGGVGPVNVAMLLENLVKATENQIS